MRCQLTNNYKSQVTSANKLFHKSISSFFFKSNFLDVEKDATFIDSQRPGLRISTFFRQLAFEILYVLEFAVLLGFGLSEPLQVKEFTWVIAIKGNSKVSLSQLVLIIVSFWVIGLLLRILYYTQLHIWRDVILEDKLPTRKELEKHNHVDDAKIQENFFQYVFMSRNTWICGSLKNIQTTLVILPKTIIEKITGQHKDLDNEFKDALNKENSCGKLMCLPKFFFGLCVIILLLVALVLCIPIILCLLLWNLMAQNGFKAVSVEGELINKNKL